MPAPTESHDIRVSSHPWGLVRGKPHEWGETRQWAWLSGFAEAALNFSHTLSHSVCVCGVHLLSTLSFETSPIQNHFFFFSVYKPEEGGFVNPQNALDFHLYI